MGYRTISTDAALVLARLIPIDLLAQERKRLDEYKSKNTKLTESIRNMERKITINSWQHRWSEGSNAQWTKRFITDIQWWTEKESKINHYTTQWLTGHGSFKKYKKRIGKVTSDICSICESEDSVEHAIFNCKFGLEIRDKLQERIGQHIRSPEDVRNLISQEWKNWYIIKEAYDEIMRYRFKAELEADKSAKE